MNCEEKTQHVIDAIYKSILPADNTVKAPVIKGWPITCSPTTDKVIEDYFIKEGKDISDGFIIPPEKNTAGINLLAIHSKHIRLNIVLAHLGGVLDWKTIDTTTAVKENYTEIPKWEKTKKDKKDNLGMCEEHPDAKIVFSTWGPMCPKCREENAKKGGRP